MRAGADVYACARMRLNSISGQGFALYIYIYIYFNNSLLLLLILNPLSAGDFTVVYLALIMPCFVCCRPASLPETLPRPVVFSVLSVMPTPPFPIYIVASAVPISTLP